MVWSAVWFYCDIKIKILGGVHSAFNKNEKCSRSTLKLGSVSVLFFVSVASFFLSHILAQDNQNASAHHIWNSLEPQFHKPSHLVPPCHLDILGLMVTVVPASPCVGLLRLKINYTFWQEDLLFKAICLQWHWGIFLCDIAKLMTLLHPHFYLVSCFWII